MAVYYKWIKGCAPGASLTSGLWTYLKWGSGDSGTSQMPTLHINTGKNDTTQSGEMGYLLTNKMPTPNIANPWVFQAHLYCVDGNQNATEKGVHTGLLRVLEQEHYKTAGKVFHLSHFTVKTGGYDAHPIQIWGDNHRIGGSAYLGVNVDKEKGELNYNTWTAKVFENKNATRTDEILPGVVIHGETIITTGQTGDGFDNFYAQGGCYLGAQLGKNEDPDKPTKLAAATFPAYSDPDTPIYFYKKLVVSGQPVSADYFNATSDKRAKENIQSATYNALELIKKLPIYTYNYKNKSENLTGILAQDLLEAQPKELDLVSNTNATGENGDYMSIKNDKLMFVLMKAIQEQQEQIEKLQAEIQQLKQA